ncbi:hypothetical protein P6144_03835 [Sphingomonas sp. HITSZ_GF]|uniref:hypothetical protein n=1 Tax=Sphingomonas sp. HITSZ_GF TaxID=3037247 RepID=UPI00240D0F36|nr:hypothetical protein [Sphingomonas sp. HITSZ_GF]MDG2532764.1 hypothetical protein [Sphingomonas sp. HITSZ_GF]
MARSEHPYHRSLAPMMWVFAGLAGLELVIVHFLLALWDWRIALVVTLASLAAVTWLVRAIRSFRTLPVTIDDGCVTFRAGHIATLAVPVANIAAIRTQWAGPEIKQRDLLNLGLIAYPNVLVEFSAPVPRRRRAIRAVAHRFDDPAAFIAALEAARMPA